MCFKFKIKVKFTYVAPQSTYAAVCHRQQVNSPGHGPSPHPHILTCSNTDLCSPSLLFNGLHPHNPCKFIDYYSFTDLGGMEGWVGLDGWPITFYLPTKWLPVNHWSGTSQKVCQPKTDVLTTEPRRQLWYCDITDKHTHYNVIHFLHRNNSTWSAVGHPLL